MKIKLCILCEDSEYLNRISTIFNVNYAHRVDLVSFSKYDSVINHFKTKNVDVFLCDSGFDFDMELLPKECGFAYLVDSMEMLTFRTEIAICKYQRIDIIYNSILKIFADCMPEHMNFLMNGDNGKIVTFTSPIGGVGNSTMAIAFAQTAVEAGSTAIYIDLTKTGDCSEILHGSGNTSFSDVLFALESNKKNMPLKIEAAIRKDDSKICYFQPANNALEMNEFTEQYFDRLIDCLMKSDLFDYIVVDMDFALDDFMVHVLEHSHNIAVSAFANSAGNKVLERGLRALEILENQKELRFLDQLCIIYNKCKEDSRFTIEYNDIIYGRIPEIDYMEQREVINQIAMGGILTKLIN